ncbi:hypothetical protein TNCV_4639971 [Trichonephila clavipes]|nr:hypothetical protein TNCV_4639971 [Trichonephila clavipes]
MFKVSVVHLEEKKSRSGDRIDHHGTVGSCHRTEPPVRFSGWSIPYPTDQVREHRNIPEPHHANHLPNFSRKLWIIQVQ